MPAAPDVSGGTADISLTRRSFSKRIPLLPKAEITVVVSEMGSAVAIRFPSSLGLVNRRASHGMIATGREVCHWFHTRAAFADRSCMLQQRCIG